MHSEKAKKLIIALSIILIWQFTFPQPLYAQTDVGQDIIDRWNNVSEESQPSDSPSNELPLVPDKPEPAVKETMYISVTAYSSTPDQTQGDPFTTASGTQVREGVIAANFLPIGTKVRFPEHFGNKVFTVEDRMHQRYWKYADIWMPSRDQAIEWGVRYTQIEILES